MKPLASLPFVAIVVGLVGPGCAIVNRGGDDDECIDLDEVCPNLVCDGGHRVVDGCEICECANDCGDVGSPPATCPSPTIVDCVWTCGDCFDSFDCPAGFACTPVGQDRAEPPPGGGGAAPEPPAGGICVDDGSTCAGDADCNGNQFCRDGFCFTKSECESGAECPSGTCDLRCESDPSCPACDVCLLVGTCLVIPCERDEECPGGRCDFSVQVGNGGDGAAEAPPLPSGQCVFDVTVCSSDADCPTDSRCNAGIDVCNPPPDCVDGEPCDDVCFGECVP